MRSGTSSPDLLSWHAFCCNGIHEFHHGMGFYESFLPRSPIASGPESRENKLNRDRIMQFRNRTKSVTRTRVCHLSWYSAAFLVCAAVFGLVSCAPANRHMVAQPAPVLQPPPTQVYFYPKAGQTPRQQDRDRYECYNWAVKQTGFEPNASPLPTVQRVRMVPAPAPGRDTAIGAVAGAAIGALAGGPRHALGGALVGGAFGGVAGAVSDANRQENARTIERSYAMQDQAQYAALEQRAQTFKRAMSACLEGRGYTVR